MLRFRLIHDKVATVALLRLFRRDLIRYLLRARARGSTCLVESFFIFARNVEDLNSVLIASVTAPESPVSAANLSIRLLAVVFQLSMQGARVWLLFVFILFFVEFEDFAFTPTEAFGLD